MQRPARTACVAIATLIVTIGLVAPPASASLHYGQFATARDGVPNVAAGLDGRRLKERAYIEELSTTSEKVSAVKAKLVSEAGDLSDAVDFGVAPGSKQMIVYWSGSTTAPALGKIRQLANADGLGLLVAPRKVGKAQLTAATNHLESNAANYADNGITLSGYGGFSADFDGIQVYVDKEKSQLKDIGAIKARLEADLGIPVNAEFGAGVAFYGKYDDVAPFYGGAIMWSGSNFCTTGFAVVQGASKYRYLSARHCNSGAYTSRQNGAGAVMGSQQLVGTGYNGAAVYSAGGSPYVYDGSNVGNPTSFRTVTQRDPGLSTVGTVVCQEGANMGQRCGTIRQVALLWNDGYGTLKVNYVRSADGSIIGAPGDSGAAVISQHTQQRAWAVGILQGAVQNANDRSGAACGARFAPSICTDNFVFTNVDYALSGFTGYAIRYY